MASLGKCSFCVYALGDSEYADNFCKAGRDLEQIMLQIGATKVCERVEEDASFRKEVLFFVGLRMHVFVWACVYVHNASAWVTTLV